MVHIPKHGTCNRAIKSFVGLKSKIRILTTENNHVSKKSKGNKKNVVNDELNMKITRMFCSIDHIEDMK